MKKQLFVLIVLSSIATGSVFGVLTRSGARKEELASALRKEELASALRHASRNGNNAEVERLIAEEGADVTGTDLNGYTALYAAVQNGHTETCRLLIENKANVNATDKQGVTPLHYAAERGHTEICRLLIENKAKSLYEN